jgi:hypothetical protein
MRWAKMNGKGATKLVMIGIGGTEITAVSFTDSEKTM